MLSHTDERPHLCKKCNYTSKNLGAMKKHAKRHESVNGPLTKQMQWNAKY